MHNNGIIEFLPMIKLTLQQNRSATRGAQKSTYPVHKLVANV